MLYRAHLVSQHIEPIIDRNRVMLTQLSPGLYPPLILSLRTVIMAVHRAALSRCCGDREERSHALTYMLP